MSMDTPSATSDTRDIDMSEAAADDPDLALGKPFAVSCFPIIYLVFHDFLSIKHPFIIRVCRENSIKHYLISLLAS